MRWLYLVLWLKPTGQEPVYTSFHLGEFAFPIKGGEPDAS